MNMYQCVLTKDGLQKENFQQEAKTGKELLSDLRCYQYDGTWTIYLYDVVIVTGTA